MLAYSNRLKCDRQVPCESCLKRGEEASCTYSNAEKQGRDKRDCDHRDSEAQFRLQRLEEMVTTLIQTNKEWSENENRSDKVSLHKANGDRNFDDASVDSSLQNSEPPSKGHSTMEVSDKEYVNPTHWTAILEKVGRPPSKTNLQCLAHAPRFEKSKVFWSRSQMKARTYNPRLLPTVMTS